MKTTLATTFNNWTKQLSKLKRSKANFTTHNVVKGIKKSNNCARANIDILLVNLPVTDINEFAISVADTFADPIIGTPLVAIPYFLILMVLKGLMITPLKGANKLEWHLHNTV